MKELDINAILLQKDEHPILFQPTYSRRLKSLPAGVVLSQLLYWNKAVGGRQFYKTDAEIIAETTVSTDQLKPIKKLLARVPGVHMELIGVPPRTNYRFDLVMIARWAIGDIELNPICGKSTNQEVENPHPKKRKIHKSISVESTAQIVGNPPNITETTQETTAETTTKNVPAKKLAGSQKIPKLNWSKESAKVFDLVQAQETRAAGIEVAPFDWNVNQGENFRQLENLRKTIIRNMNLKRGLPETADVDFTEYSATLELYLGWAWRYYRKQQELTHVLNYTPTSCYRDFNKIKTYASTAAKSGTVIKKPEYDKFTAGVGAIDPRRGF